MVKIYINNINLKDMEDKLDSFNKYPTKKSVYTKIYSTHEDGIYIIENKNIYLLEPNLNDHIKEIKYGKLDLVLDFTPEIKIKIISQLPVNYILSKITRIIYKIDNLYLIIDGIYEKNSLNKKHFKKKNLIDDFTKVFVPIDFYLEYNEPLIYNKECIKNENKNENKDFDINNRFFREALNVFLSHLI